MTIHVAESVAVTSSTHTGTQAGYRAAAAVGALVDHSVEPPAPPATSLSQHALTLSSSAVLQHQARLARHTACPVLAIRNSFTRTSLSQRRSSSKCLRSGSGIARTMPGSADH